MPGDEVVDGVVVDADLAAAAAIEQAAIARGDVIIPAETDKIELEDFDPEFLKTLAGEVDAGKLPAEENFIPKARLNELSQQVKDSRTENAKLQARLEELEAGKLPVKEVIEVPVDNRLKLKELRGLIRDADLEGDTETLSELEDARDELLIQIAREDINKERTQTEVATSVQQVKATAIVEFPFLDEKSADADLDAINSVIRMTGELMGKGKSQVEALQLAVAEKGPKFAKALGFVVNPVIELKPDTRDAEALKRAADTSLRQPAALQNRVEKDSFTIDVSKMTDKQIMAQPEEVRAKLRGDIV
jgi:hypothetical protein